MKIQTKTPMEVSDSYPAPINAFLQDSYNMGTNIGTNVTVMYDVHTDKPATYIIVVDRMTGERIKIEFEK